MASSSSSRPIQEGKYIYTTDAKYVKFLQDIGVPKEGTVGLDGAHWEHYAHLIGPKRWSILHVCKDIPQINFYLELDEDKESEHVIAFYGGPCRITFAVPEPHRFQVVVEGVLGTFNLNEPYTDKGFTVHMENKGVHHEEQWKRAEEPTEEEKITHLEGLCFLPLVKQGEMEMNMALGMSKEDASNWSNDLSTYIKIEKESSGDEKLSIKCSTQNLALCRTKLDKNYKGVTQANSGQTLTCRAILNNYYLVLESRLEEPDGGVITTSKIICKKAN